MALENYSLERWEGWEEARLFPEELKDNIQSLYEWLFIAHIVRGIRVLEGVDGKIKYIIPVTTSQGQYLTNSSWENLETPCSPFKLATISKRVCRVFLAELGLISQRSGEYHHQLGGRREPDCLRSPLDLPSTLPPLILMICGLQWNESVAFQFESATSCWGPAVC